MLAVPPALWLSAAIVTLTLRLFALWSPPPPRPPPIELTGADIEMIEYVLADEPQELTDADIPVAPPPPPQAPEEEPPNDEPEDPSSSEPDVQASTDPATPAPAPAGEDDPSPETMSEAVAELDEPQTDEVADAAIDGDPEGEDDPELVAARASEAAKQERRERIEALADARVEGMLSLGDLGFDRTELDPGYTDGRRWDGVFGPRDSHVLLAALTDGTVDELRGEKGSGGGYTMSMSSFGMGFMGMGRPIRLPPGRDLLEPADPRYPRKLRKELGVVDCVLHVTVDGAGHAVGMKVRDCPEELHELAFEAAHRSLWSPAADLTSEATVKYVVEFRPKDHLEAAE